jgi:hypothetical protein
VSGHSGPPRLYEDEELVEFYGQLWSVSCPTAPRVSQIRPNWFWIWRDLWETRSFSWKDCHSVKAEDTPRADSKEGKFAEDFWGGGELYSFRDVLKGEMAGHGNHGRGRGRGGRFQEEQWGGPSGWWNQAYPPSPFLHHRQFQPQFGFFPTQAPTLIQVKLSTATTTLQCTSKVRVVISMVSRDRGSSTSRHPDQEGKRLSRSKVQSKVKWMRSRSWLWRKRW